MSKIGIDNNSDLTSLQTRIHLQIGNTKLWDLINRGELTAYKVGRTIRITRDSIESYKRRNLLPPKFWEVK